MDVGIQISVRVPAVDSFQRIPRSGIAGSAVSDIPSSGAWGSDLSVPSPTLLFPRWFFGDGDVIVATLTAVIQHLVVGLTYAHSLLHWLCL